VIAYHILLDGSEYRELGGTYYDQLHPERTRNRLVRRLERMGLEVHVTPKEGGRANQLSPLHTEQVVFEGRWKLSIQPNCFWECSLLTMA
jgi:hypothetical protein